MGKANILNEFLKDINKDKIISSDDNDLNK